MPDVLHLILAGEHPNEIARDLGYPSFLSRAANEEMRALVEDEQKLAMVVERIGRARSRRDFFHTARETYLSSQ